MSKKNTKTTVLEGEAPKELSKADQKRLADAIETIKELSSASVILADINGTEMAACMNIVGKNPVDSVEKFRNLLLTALIFNQRNKNPELEDEVTQGRLNLAYCIAVDMVHKLIDVGAEDFAGIHEEIVDEDFDWIELDDVIYARTDDTVIGNEPKGTFGKHSTREEVEEVLSTVFDVPREEIAKMLDGKFNKGEGKVVVAKKKLSKDQMEKLSSILDEVDKDEE